MGFRFASAVVRSALAATKQVKLSDSVPRELVDDIFSSAIRKQTGVSLRYMLDFGANPIKRQLVLSAQFLHNELPVRLAHRVAELENLPYGLSAKPQVLRVGNVSVNQRAVTSMTFRLSELMIKANEQATISGQGLVCGVFQGSQGVSCHQRQQRRAEVHRPAAAYLPQA